MSQVPAGRFLWYECLTSDAESAIDFYTKLIGWGTTVWDGGEEPYTMWLNGEAPVGGVMPLPEEAKADGAEPFWLPYVSTPDTSATAERVKQLGGAVMHGPMTVPTIGDMAVLRDPQGAVFACYTPENTPDDVDAPPSIGRFSWNELAATDWEAAFAFYSELFGWEKTDAVDIGDMGTYQMYGNPGSPMPLGGMFNKPPEMPMPAWVLYTMVDDVDSKAETIKQLGGQVTQGPMEVPGGDRIVQGVDPQGAMFALHSISSTG